MKFPSYGLVYDYSLEDGGVSRKHSKDDDDEEHHTGEVRLSFKKAMRVLWNIPCNGCCIQQPERSVTEMFLNMFIFINVSQVKWVNWMTGVAMPAIPAEMNFSDIIIPTMDLVRGSFVLEMLLTNNKKVRQSSSAVAYNHS